MDVEAEISRLRGAAHWKACATLVIESYGPEVLSFLEIMLRDHADAADAFSQACEDLWKSLPRFEARAAMKTWFYTLARHAASRLRRSSRPGRHARLSEITELAQRVRSRTQPHQMTELKAGFAAIRAELEDADRMLLVLRVDRAMSWKDVARVLAEIDDDDSDEAVSRRAARLRKRWQSVKESIRERAIAAGLVSRTDADHET
jgi:RNA polymerase sigma-70 factor (ECF subfamily)